MKHGNGYGSVYKMHGNRRRPYIAAVTIKIDGKRKRKALGYYENSRDALAALSAYHNQPYDISARNITVREFIEKWLAYRATRQKGIVATRDYEIILRRHCKSVMDKRFIDIQSIHIQQLVDNAKSPHIAITIKTAWGLLYKYAALLGITNENPARIVERPTKPKSTIHKPFTNAEIQALWKHDSRIAKYALIYIYTGLRPSELLNIRRDDVHLEERYMIGGIKTTAGINRTIPIAERILPLIQEIYDQNNGEYLTSMRTYAAILHAWKHSAIPELLAHLPHDGRHTCETALDNARVNKRIIQLIIGHAGRDIDEAVYTHKTREQLIEAINQIDAIYSQM